MSDEFLALPSFTDDADTCPATERDPVRTLPAGTALSVLWWLDATEADGPEQAAG